MLRIGRPLGYFIFSCIGLKRTLFTYIFQRLERASRKICCGQLQVEILATIENEFSDPSGKAPKIQK